MSTVLLPSERIALPLLPLRDVVVFPHMVIPLFVGRPKSIKALETAMESGKSIMLVAQKNAAKDEPVAEDIYPIGCVANILQMLKLPDGTMKVLVEGAQRAHIHEIADAQTHFTCELTPVAPEPSVGAELEAAGPEGTTALLADPPVAEVERAEGSTAVTPRLGVERQGLFHAAPRRILAVVTTWPA